MLMNCQSLNKGNYVSRKLKLLIVSISLWSATILLLSLLSFQRASVQNLSNKELIIKKPVLWRTVGSVSPPSKNEGEYRANSPPTTTLAMRIARSLLSANLSDQREKCIVYELSESGGCLIKRTTKLFRQRLAFLCGHLK